MSELPLDQFITFRLLRLTNQLNRQAGKILASKVGLRLPEWRCLAILGAYGSMQVNQIATKLSADKGLISRSLSSLEKSRLVKTKRSAEDRRQIVIALTSRGRKTVSVMMPIMQKRQRVLIDALSKKEQNELHRMIDKLHIAVDAIDNEFVQKNLN
tara:strand:- start:224 stop:691 length:468 start_codon:yes stop_codon:yes gene_type:complete